MGSASKDKGKVPLVVHIIYRLATGGLENGLVNLINHMPPDRYRHAIICLTDSTGFRNRVQQADVPIIALHKRTGQDLGMHVRLWKILRNLLPDIVHTRNIGSLEYLIPATLAKVQGHIHGEHGLDMYELNGSNFRYNLLRKVIKPLVHHYIAVSKDLTNWLIGNIGIRPDRISQIYNGVDLVHFRPCVGSRPPIGPKGFASQGSLILGTVGRLEKVKNQLTLVKAFLHLINTGPGATERLRLVIIGDGPLREEAQQLLRAANAEHLAWLPGERNDVPEVMRGLDLFILPSLREGVSNTILEAMASGLPVIATRVGGNPELVEDGKTGILVPSANPEAMAEAIRNYLDQRDQLLSHGEAGRKRVESQFSMEAMVKGYLRVYDDVLNGAGSE